MTEADYYLGHCCALCGRECDGYYCSEMCEWIDDLQPWDAASSAPIFYTSPVTSQAA